jgi:hypothetical protein
MLGMVAYQLCWCWCIALAEHNRTMCTVDVVACSQLLSSIVFFSSHTVCFEPSTTPVCFSLLHVVSSWLQSHIQLAKSCRLHAKVLVGNGLVQTTCATCK